MPSSPRVLSPRPQSLSALLKSKAVPSPSSARPMCRARPPTTCQRPMAASRCRRRCATSLWPIWSANALALRTSSRPERSDRVFFPKAGRLGDSDVMSTGSATGTPGSEPWAGASRLKVEARYSAASGTPFRPKNFPA
eukprot:scaffold182362_cov26-Tisochrysis_lutea.AAC.8